MREHGQVRLISLGHEVEGKAWDTLRPPLTHRASVEHGRNLRLRASWPPFQKETVALFRKPGTRGSLCSLSLSSRLYQAPSVMIYIHIFLFPLDWKILSGGIHVSFIICVLQCLEWYPVGTVHLQKGRTHTYLFTHWVRGGSREKCSLPPDFFLAMLCWRHAAHRLGSLFQSQNPFASTKGLAEQLSYEREL